MALLDETNSVYPPLDKLKERRDLVAALGGTLRRAKIEVVQSEKQNYTLSSQFKKTSRSMHSSWRDIPERRMRIPSN